MNESKVAELLVAGGTELPLPGADDADLPAKYRGMADPRGAEVLGLELASRIRARDADVVLVWEDIDDIVLAHVVARELGASVVRAVAVDGLLDYEGSLAGDDRVVLVSDRYASARVLTALQRLVERKGASVVAVCAFYATTALREAIHSPELVQVLVDERSRESDSARGSK